MKKTHGQQLLIIINYFDFFVHRQHLKQYLLYRLFPYPLFALALHVVVLVLVLVLMVVVVVVVAVVIKIIMILRHQV